MLIGLLLIKCGKNDNRPAEDIESVGEMEFDTSKIYIPSEFSNGEFDNNQDGWSWIRSRQSENFIVFWEPGFGNNPNSESIPIDYRFDVDFLLNKLEYYYQVH